MGIFDLFKKKPTVESYWETAIEKFQKGQYQSAYDEIQKAIDIDPNNGALYYNRGSMKNQLRNYKEGMIDLEKSIKLKTGQLKVNGQTHHLNLAAAHFNLAVSKFHTKDNKGALKELKKAEKLGFNDRRQLDDLYYYIDEVDELGYDEAMERHT